MFPLTPAEAIAVAVTLTTHPRCLPHWQDWADRLRTWGQQQLQTEHEEGEMPSQDRILGSRDGRMGTENEAVPEVRKHRGDLTASTSTERTGGRGL